MHVDMQGYEAILPDGVVDLNDLSCDEYHKLTFRIYQDGVAHRMHVGMVPRILGETWNHE